MMQILLVLCGLAAGAFAAWLYCRPERAVLTERARAAEVRTATLENSERASRERAQSAEQDAASARATLEAERKAAAEKLAVLEDAKAKLLDAFKALSADALKSNNEAFLTLAKGTFDGMVKPVEASLKVVGETQGRLRAETEKLVSALWAPTGWGAWGELKLARAVHLAGLEEHCGEFEEQASTTTNGATVRPDMRVNLPSGKCILIDAKFPQTAFREASSATDEKVRTEKLAAHADTVRAHARRLAEKRYWEKVEGALDFVIMFLPNEGLLAAAVQQQPGLIDEAATQRVLIATPATLIAMLLAVAYGWKQQALAENAREIWKAGAQVYDRLRTLAGHFEEMRKGLERAAGAYNSAVGSLEHSVLPGARRLKDLGCGSDPEAKAPGEIATATRALQAPELTPEEVGACSKT